MQPFSGPGSTSAEVDPENGAVVLQVPNKRLARLVQLGVHVERAERLKRLHRRMARDARRRNRRRSK